MATALGPVTLHGEGIELQPLRPEHAPGLLKAGQSAEIWEHLSVELRSLADVQAYIAKACDAERQEREYAFAVLAAEDGRVLGSTRYLDVDHQNRTAEIGWTWYAPDVWGTAVNPEAKLLLLRHAFDDWQANRVCLKTDIRNVHSQTAIRKLGAQFEGILRQDRVRRDGSLRDTVVFSILNTEWPAVRAGLQARLEAFSSR